MENIDKGLDNNIVIMHNNNYKELEDSISSNPEKMYVDESNHLLNKTRSKSESTLIKKLSKKKNKKKFTVIKTDNVLNIVDNYTDLYENNVLIGNPDKLINSTESNNIVDDNSVDHHSEIVYNIPIDLSNNIVNDNNVNQNCDFVYNSPTHLNSNNIDSSLYPYLDPNVVTDLVTDLDPDIDPTPFIDSENKNKDLDKDQDIHSENNDIDNDIDKEVDIDKDKDEDKEVDIDSNVDPHIDVDPDEDSESDPNIDPDIDPNIDPNIDPDEDTSYIKNIQNSTQFFGCFDVENSVNNAIDCSCSGDEKNIEVTSSYIFEKDPLLMEHDNPDPFDKFDIYDQDKIKHKNQKNIGKLGVVTFSAIIMLGSACITKYLS